MSGIVKSHVVNGECNVPERIDLKNESAIITLTLGRASSAGSFAGLGKYFRIHSGSRNMIIGSYILHRTPTAIESPRLIVD
jgi:hypothetical protein